MMKTLFRLGKHPKEREDCTDTKHLRKRGEYHQNQQQHELQATAPTQMSPETTQ